ncbi:MAG: ParB/RepB/Spo0J family partition protein [Streptococcaceae bacterium]|jgi:ParB family chromosome partitioning protein|nr:ParB/RepB/Spo0J family partition protein [Streptococcaceae bacterium]
MTEKISNLKLTEIVRNPYQPRLIFDEEKLRELADSILENGILQPIIVRPSALTGYELLAGERRFLASQKAGLTEIPAVIRDYSDKEMMTLSILENLQRENLNPLEEAKSLKHLTNSGLTHAEIAKILGKSRSYVTNNIRILKLPQEILYLIETEKLSLGHARALLALETEISQIELAREIIKKNLSVRAVEKRVTADKKSETAVSSHISKNNQLLYVEETEEKLKQILGNVVKISTNSQFSGKISLSFNTLDELEGLISRLKK